MRWPWQRRTKDMSPADKALETSEIQHQQVVDHADEVRRVMEAHRDFREKNHFAELFARALKEGR